MIWMQISKHLFQIQPKYFITQTQNKKGVNIREICLKLSVLAPKQTQTEIVLKSNSKQFFCTNLPFFVVLMMAKYFFSFYFYLAILWLEFFFKACVEESPPDLVWRDFPIVFSLEKRVLYSTNICSHLEIGRDWWGSSYRIWLGLCNDCNVECGGWSWIMGSCLCGDPVAMEKE